MQFGVKKRVSPLIPSQFPRFYRQEGPNFVEFVRSYYQWLESQADPTTGTPNPVGAARNLFDYRDIDNTSTDFLSHFQKKYLYGIPFNVIANKRFLLKHILDVYRSKGSIQCYDLLFQLIYDAPVTVYIPGRDILKPSDGTWIQPIYLEVSNTGHLTDLVGATVVGSSSGTTATVEDFVTEYVNENIVRILYLSNVLPVGGTFIVGEKVYDASLSSDEILSNATTVLGSLGSIDIQNGGQNFRVGDILGVAHRSPSNNQIVSFGEGSLLRVTGIGHSTGSLAFSVQDSGWGYSNTGAGNISFVFNANTDTTGSNASFSVGVIGSTRSIEYNTDLLASFYTTPLNAVAYGFPGNTSANSSTPFNEYLSFSNSIFGSVVSLDNVRTGNKYVQPATTFVATTMKSNSLVGSISYSSGSKTITGTNTAFTDVFLANSFVYLQANASDSNTGEYGVILAVTNATSMSMYANAKYTSTSSAVYAVATPILPAQFASYDPEVATSNGSIDGENAIVSAFPSVGNDVVVSVTAYNSGKGYVESEKVSAYRYSVVASPTVLTGGKGYSNGDALSFSGGTLMPAQGYVETDANGSIVSAIVTYSGSGYVSIPTIAVQTRKGTGAALTTKLIEYDTSSEISGYVVKQGMGVKPGYWSTTHGFLDADKYIQDSYYYQEFSYEIQSPLLLSEYEGILYDTFHPAGTAMFGRFVSKTKVWGNSVILGENMRVSG